MSDFGGGLKEKFRAGLNAAALRTSWAVAGMALLVGVALVGDGEDKNLCVSFQTSSGSRNFCIGVSTVPSAPVESQQTPEVPQVIPIQPENSAVPGRGILQNAPLSPEQQEIARKRTEEYIRKMEDPCNPNGLFAQGMMLERLQGFQRPEPSCI